MFKTMTGCLDPKKSPSIDDLQKIPSFVFCRWLSGNIYTILAANQINYYFDIPIENQYNMIKNVFAGKIKYIPYPKKEPESDLEKQKIIEYLCDYFKINNYDAVEYLDLISKEELTKIIEMYKNLENK